MKWVTGFQISTSYNGAKRARIYVNLTMFEHRLRCYCILLAAGIIFYSCSQRPKESPSPSTDFCSSVHRSDTTTLDGALAPIRDLMAKQSGAYVLEDGAGSMVARAWLSEHAKEAIDVQYFIFSTDNVGLIACDYLVRAADRGVKVRILVDDIMVEATMKELLTVDCHENISIRVYNPGVNLGKNIIQKLKKMTTDFRSANQRMHNKTFTVDGKVVITGGRNIADEYFDYDHAYNFRDRDVLLLGKITAAVHQSFEQFWNNPLSVPVTSLVDEDEIPAADPTLFARLHEYACDSANFWPEVRNQIDHLAGSFDHIRNSGRLVWMDSISFVSDEPGKNDGSQGLAGGGATTSALIDLINGAKHSIEVQSPYLITTELGRKVFRDAVSRGVKVRILTNSLASTDNMEAFSGYQRDRQKLLRTGVRIFEFRPDARIRYRIMTGALQDTLGFRPIFGLHAKSMVVDGKTVVIGTFNLDPRSANLNTECITIIHSAPIAGWVRAGMEEEFKPENAWETTMDSNPDSYASDKKYAKMLSRRVVPKSIL